MKRIFLLITLLLIIGMTIPSAVFAGNSSNNGAAFDRDAQSASVRGTCGHVPDLGKAAADVDICRAQQAAKGHSGGLDKSFSPKRTWGESLRRIFGRFFISHFPGTGIVVINVKWDNPDDPLGTNIAPWAPRVRNHALDPGGDEDGWDETK